MKTEALIARLAADLRPVRRGMMQRRLAVAVVAGGAASVLILVAWLGLRPLGLALASPSFWIKSAYTLALAAGGWVAVGRLARPDGDVGAGPVLVLLAFGALGLVGLGQLSMAPPQTYSRLVFGHSWSACPLRIVALSLPILAGLTMALRSMAPTRPGLAGAAAGLLAGGAGASVYGLYCTETSSAFVVLWYSLGVAAMAGVGALAGRYVLRW